MRFAICNELFEGWDFARMVEFVKNLGYDGVELAPFTFADSVADISKVERKGIRNLAEVAGLDIVGLHWLLTRPAGLHLTHSDETVRAATVEYLKRLIEFCADVGGRIMVFGSPGQRSVPEGMSLRDGWQHAVEGFRACADAARDSGITICLEALPAQMTNLLNTNEDVLQMVDEIDHPNIQMMLDVKSMFAESIPVVENIRRCRGRFKHVHANDANMRGPGFGDVDFRPILAALKDSGYKGYVSVEVFDYTPDPETIARESLRYLRECLPSRVNEKGLEEKRHE